MYSAEKKTILSILVLYLSSTIIILSLLSNNYYEYEKEKLQSEEENIVLNHAKKIYNILEEFHNKLEGKMIYPRYKEFNSAIYNIDKNELYSTLKDKKINFDEKFYYKGDYSYLIYDVKPYYLGAAYIVIEMKNHVLLQNVGKNVMTAYYFAC